MVDFYCLTIASKMLFPPGSFKYASESWDMFSYLDHVITNSNVHSSVGDVKTLKVCTDNNRVCMSVNTD